MKDIIIFNGFHSDCRLIENEIVKPLLLGAANKNVNFAGFKDNDGDNISDLNPIYCELTGQYWMWKNIECDYIGFFHYRRQLLFNESNNLKSDNWGLLNYDVNSKNLEKELCIEVSNIRSIVGKYDVVLPEKWNVQNAGSKSMYDHYLKTDKLNIKDLDKAVEIVKRDYPHFKEIIQKSMNSKEGYFTNIFVMKKEIYNKYCEWLFPILFETYESIDDKYYNTQEYRSVGYIAEWLFNLYFNYLFETNKQIKSIHLKRTMLQGDYINIEPIIRENKKSIPIVLCGDENYVKYMMTATQSIYENKGENIYLDLIFFTDKFSQETKNKIKHSLRNKIDISIRIVEVEQFKNDKMYAHINFLTMYRLKIHEILEQYDKVIYLDSDLIVKSDISELYDIDLDDKPLGATPCFGFKCMYAIDLECDAKVYDSRLRSYMREYVEIKDKNIDSYFNAGVLLLNLDYLRKDGFGKKFEEYYNRKKRNLLYMDQDILNYIYQGNYVDISGQWNFGTVSEHDQQNHMPAIVKMDYDKLKKNYKIVHYIGGAKPWNYVEDEYSFEFWNYARNTLWYESILLRLQKEENSQKLGLLYRVYNKTPRKIRKIIRAIVPNKTKVRLLRRIR